MQSLHLRGRELCSTSSRVKYLHPGYLKFFCTGNFASSPPLIYLIIYLYQLWAHGNLFYIWVVVQNYFISQVPSLATGILSVVFCGFFGLFVCLFFVFSTSLLPGTIRYSGLILYIFCPSPRLSLFSREPWFL